MKVKLVFLALIFSTAIPNNALALNRPHADDSSAHGPDTKRKKMTHPHFKQSSQASMTEKDIPAPSEVTHPLHQAAEEGNVHKIQKLLQAGIDINSLDEHSRSALHWASEKGHTEVVKFLLLSSANTKFLDYKNKRAEDIASTTIIRNLIHGKESFSSAAYECDVIRMQQLLLHGAGIYINTRDPYGRTPLHFAAWNNNAAQAALLLKTPGINVNAKDCWGTTPLHDAASLGYILIIELLLKYGANPSITDKQDRLAKDVAANKATLCALTTQK